MTNRDYRCQNAKGFGHGIDGGFAELIKLDSHHVTVIPESHNLIGACLYGCPIGVANEALNSKNLLRLVIPLSYLESEVDWVFMQLR